MQFLGSTRQARLCLESGSGLHKQLSKGTHQLFRAPALAQLQL